MKRALLLLCAVVTTTLSAGNETLNPAVRNVIAESVVHEREAVARYQAFAAKAAEEGYAGVAALFRAQARSEKTHEERFASLLQSHGLAVPEHTPPAPRVSSTIDNLRTAASAEMAERDGSYHDAIETCQLHKATEIAKIFDQTRDSEVEHVNLCNAAARSLESMKEPRSYHVCGRCGYLTDVALPFCPSCQRKAPLESVE